MRYLTRQERREERKLKRKQKFPRHSRGLMRIYREAVLRRLREAEIAD